jgi:hypothetical protein
LIVAQFIFLAAWPAATSSGAGSPIAAAPRPGIRIERTNVPGGGELITYFKPGANPFTPGTDAADVPLVSILRDTLGDADPANDQLRDVWAFTYSRQSVWKRVLAGVPFLYHRLGAEKASGTPPALIDMADPAKGTVKRLLGSVAQSMVLDPLGLPYRATTRAYRSRSGEYRNTNLWRALGVLAAAEQPADAGLSTQELDHVRGRLLLARSPVGGWVQDRYVAPAWNRFESMSSQARGHNWELLRQRAEDNQLYFQSLEQPSSAAAPFALLWMDQAEAGARVSFDSKFLGISDPFRDPRIRNWKEYSETWTLDPNAREARMIPLALYALDHPRTPLLLVDFRDPSKPRRREMLRRAADDVAIGMLGWTGFGHWPYMAAKTSWTFVHGRHGAALDRDARVRAYVQVRAAMLAEEKLDPNLRRELARRMDRLGVNPLEEVAQADQENARRQYAALLHSVENGKMEAHLAARRVHEAEAIRHAGQVRAARRAATVLSFGIYRHREAETPELLASVDRERRMQWHRHYLEQVLAAGPKPEVVADMEQVRQSIAELTRLAAEMPKHRADTARLVAQFSSVAPSYSSVGGQ